MPRRRSVGGWIRYRVGLDGNPLRRPVDRGEAWARILLLVVLVIAGPALAWGTGRHVYRDGAAVERIERYATPAVLVDDAPFPTGTYAMAVLPTVTAAARWTAPDGARRAGPVPVVAGTPAGTAVTVWTDPAGALVARPRRHADTTLDALLAALGVAAGVALLVAFAWLALRRLLDRSRLTAWQSAWAIVGPQWTAEA